MKKIFTYAWIMLIAMTAAITLNSCERDDQYEADLLISGDWQGYLGEYYSDRWGLTGTEYETVMHFDGRGAGSTSGRGYQVDYNTRSRYRDFAYCGFQWSIVQGQITLIYDDAEWTPVYIYDYSLSASRFRGYMDDGTRRTIKFDLQNLYFNDWGRYNNSYYNDDYYYVRGANAAALPTVTDNGKSIRSGVFAQ